MSNIESAKAAYKKACDALAARMETAAADLSREAVNIRALGKSGTGQHVARKNGPDWYDAPFASGVDFDEENEAVSDAWERLEVDDGE